MIEDTESNELSEQGINDSLPESEDLVGQSLPPVDRGKDAWLVLVGTFVIEGLVWGFPFTSGVFQEYYSNNGQFDDNPAGATMIGTVTLGVLYLSSPLCLFALRPTIPSQIHHLGLLDIFSGFGGSFICYACLATGLDTGLSLRHWRVYDVLPDNAVRQRVVRPPQGPGFWYCVGKYGMFWGHSSSIHLLVIVTFLFPHHSPHMGSRQYHSSMPRAAFHEASRATFNSLCFEDP